MKYDATKQPWILKTETVIEGELPPVTRMHKNIYTIQEVLNRCVSSKEEVAAFLFYHGLDKHTHKRGLSLDIPFGVVSIVRYDEDGVPYMEYNEIIHPKSNYYQQKVNELFG